MSKQAWNKRVSRLLLMGVFLLTAALLGSETSSANYGSTLFTDGFESGDTTSSNQYFDWSWDNGDTGDDVNVSTNIARSGTQSLMFTFRGGASGTDSWAEQRFDLPTSQDDVWVQWYQYFPDGTEGVGPEWQHRNDTGPDNNKILLMGNKEWGGASGFSLYNVDTETTGSGDSRGTIKYRPDGGYTGVYDTKAINGGIIQDSTLRGRWVEYIVHLKTTTGFQKYDGIAEVWVDGVKIHSHHHLNTWPKNGDETQAAYNTFDHGYLLGWANSGFDLESYTYIDDFALLDGPPSTLDLSTVGPMPEYTASSHANGYKKEYAYDGNLSTYWRAEGIGEWIQYDLAEAYTIDKLTIDWNSASIAFDIQISNDFENWSTVYSGTGDNTQTGEYTFSDVSARYVRIVGNGDPNSTSERIEVKEFGIWGNGNLIDPINTPVVSELSVNGITSSGYQTGNTPGNTIDNDLNTRWSAYADVDPQWIQYDLGDLNDVEAVDIAWYKGDERTATFDIEVSEDGSNWTAVYNGTSSGTTLDQELYEFTSVAAQYVRITGYGNSQNSWAAITEVDILGVE